MLQFVWGISNSPDVRVSLNPRRFAARKVLVCLWTLQPVAAKSIDTPTTITAEGGEISTNLAYSLS